MDEEIQEKDYAAQTKAVFADKGMVASIRKRLSNQRESIDPAKRDRRWDEAIAAFGRGDADWRTPRVPGRK